MGRLMAAAAALLAACGLASAEPAVVATMPADGMRDVKVHFYVDAHRRNKDANMRKDNSHAYLRAINALKNVLLDRKNPIDEGLRRRGIGKNAEVNVWTGYLLKPDGVRAFALMGKLNSEDFGPFVREAGAWNREVLVKTILENEKSARNIVACVISNDPDLSAKHGMFHLDEERGVAFFMLHAHRESVNGGIFHPYWSVAEWEDFLREAMGENANDIANAIADMYYDIGADGKAGLEGLVCKPGYGTIAVENLRGLPRKKMWKAELLLNGERVGIEGDAVELSPANGANRVVARIVSPAGVEYARTWEGSAFAYRSLSSETELSLRITATAGKGRKEGLLTKEMKELNAFAADIEKPVREDAIPRADAAEKAVRGQLAKMEKMRELRESIGKAKADFRALSGHRLARETWAQNALAKLEKDMGNVEREVPVNPLDETLETIERLIGKCRRASGDAEALRRRLDLAEGADRLPVEIKKSRERFAKTAAAFGEMRGKAEEAKSELSAVEKLAKEKSGKITIPPEATAGIADAGNSMKRILERVEAAGRDVAAIRRKLETEAIAENEMTGIRERIGEVDAATAELVPQIANLANRIDDLRGKIEKIESPSPRKPIAGPGDDSGNDGTGKREPVDPPDEGTSPATYVVAAIAACAVAFGAKKVFGRKVVATVAYTPKGSIETVQKELEAGRALRFDEAFGCGTNLRCRAACGEDGETEYELTSPERAVWVQRTDAGERKKVGDSPTVVAEGAYLLFKEEIALSPAGKIEFGAI